MKNNSLCSKLRSPLLAFLLVTGGLPIESQAAVAVTSAPVLGTPAAQTATQNVALRFSTTNGNAITLTNLDPGADLIQLTLSVTQGTLTLNGTNGLGFTAGDGVADATMTVRGTFTNLNTALNGLRFTPATDYFGAAMLTLSGFNATPMDADLDTGLQGHYTFDNSSALGQDTSPLGANSGAVTGGTAAVDPWRFKVINLNAAGGADYVQIAGHFGNPANVTLAAWVNLTTAPSFGAEVISLGDSAFLRLDDLGYMYGYTYDDTIWRSTFYSGTLAGTGWRHVAYTFDDAGNVHKLYLDGVEVDTRVVNGSISYTLGANSFIGKHGNGSTTRNFTGRIDDARVYDRALSAGEIAGLATDLNPSLSTTNNVAITVVGPPAITSQPASQWGVEGSNVAFTVTATGTAPLSYRWAYNGTTISGATISTLDLTSIALSASGNYTVIVTNSFGSITSQVAVLSVLSIPPLAALQDTYIRNATTAIP